MTLIQKIIISAIAVIAASGSCFTAKAQSESWTDILPVALHQFSDEEKDIMRRELNNMLPVTPLAAVSPRLTLNYIIESMDDGYAVGMSWTGTPDEFFGDGDTLTPEQILYKIASELSEDTQADVNVLLAIMLAVDRDVLLSLSMPGEEGPVELILKPWGTIVPNVRE